MGTYGIAIKVKGKVIGEKIVSAPSKSYIYSHRSKYLGSGRTIGSIRDTKIKNYKKWLSQPRSKRFQSDYKRPVQRRNVFGGYRI